MKKIIISILFISSSVFGMTLSDMQTEFGYIMNEPTPTFWTNAERMSWLNQGQYDFADKVVDDAILNLMAKTSSMCVAGQQEYDLPTDYLRVYSAKISSVWASGIVLKNLPAIESNSQFVPTLKNPYFYIRSNYIGFYPIPTTSTGTISIWYIKKPFQLSQSTDTSIIPIQYHHLIVMFACVKGYEKLREFDKSTALYQEYIANITTINQRYTSRHMVEPSNIQTQAIKEGQK